MELWEKKERVLGGNFDAFDSAEAESMANGQGALFDRGTAWKDEYRTQYLEGFFPMTYRGDLGEYGEVERGDDSTYREVRMGRDGNMAIEGFGDYVVDLLPLEFPGMAGKIAQVRKEGVPDHKTWMVLRGIEGAMLEQGIPQQEIDDYFKRTAESKVKSFIVMRSAEKYMFADELDMEVEEVERVMALADFMGMSAKSLLYDENLRELTIKHLEDQGVPLTQNIVKQMINAHRVSMLSDQKAAIYALAIVRGEDPTDSKKVRDINEQIKLLRAPIMQSLKEEMAAGTVSLGTQMLVTHVTALGAGTLAGAVGSVVSTPAGGAAAAGVAYKSTAVFMNVSREIGSAYEEFLSIEDENGNKIDRRMAALFAGSFGILSGMVEFIQMETVMNGLGRNFGIGTAKVALSDSAFVKRLLKTLKDNAIDYTKEVGEEVFQRSAIILGREILKYFGGVENASFGEIGGELVEEGRSALLSFGGINAVKTAGGSVRSIRHADANLKDDLKQSLEEAIKIMRDLDEGSIKLDDIVTENNVTYVPRAMMDAYFQNIRLPQGEAQRILSSLEIHDKGVDAAKGQGEIAVSTEALNELVKRGDSSAGDELVAASRQADVGATVRDKLKSLTDKIRERLEAREEQGGGEGTPSAALYDGVYKQAVDAGIGEDQARAGASIWISHAQMVADELGISVEEAGNLVVQRANREMKDAVADGKLEGLTHPVNADVDLDQRVPVISITGVDGLTASDLLNTIRSFIGQEAMISADAKSLLEIASGNKARHIAKSSRKGLTHDEMAARSAALNSIDDVVKNSVLIESFPNADQSKETVERIHRLYVPIEYGGKIYVVRVVTHELKTSDGLIPIDAEIYDIILENKDSASPAVATPESARTDGAKGRINEITIREMLSGVKDSNGKPYIDETSLGVRGMYHTDAESGQRIISMFKAQNSSTFFHEIGHVFLDDLELMAGHEKAGDQIRQDWQTIRDWLGFEDGQTKATREQHEKFADGFLNYLNEGKAPSNALQSAFERFKNWLSHLFESGDIDKVEMSDAVREVYDRLTGKKDAIMADSSVNMVNDGGANTSPESNDSPVSELKTGQDGKIQRELEELRQYIQNELANDSEVGGRLGLDGEYGDAAVELLLARARVLAEREGISPLAWGKRLLVGSNARYDNEIDMDSKPRGRLTGLSGGKYLLSLFKTANRSTFFHETAHFFLDDLRMMAKTEDVSETTLREWNETLQWLGVADIEFDNMTESDVKRWKDAQEKFAAAFNKYQMEGKAPTSTLQSLFDKFKEWLTAVFESVENITYTNSEGNEVAFEMSDDIREVFDSMLNAEAEAGIEHEGDLRNVDYGALSSGEGESYDQADKGVRIVTSYLPRSHGKWQNPDMPGEGYWYPDKDYVPARYNKSGMTWAEILKPYNVDGIMFRNGEPDFSGLFKEEVTIEGFSKSRRRNFSKADAKLAESSDYESSAEVARLRAENNYTWHECQDMKTMQLISLVINNNIPHLGGLSKKRTERMNKERQ